MGPEIKTRGIYMRWHFYKCVCVCVWVCVCAHACVYMCPCWCRLASFDHFSTFMLEAGSLNQPETQFWLDWCEGPRIPLSLQHSLLNHLSAGIIGVHRHIQLLCELQTSELMLAQQTLDPQILGLGLGNAILL